MEAKTSAQAVEPPRPDLLRHESTSMLNLISAKLVLRPRSQPIEACILIVNRIRAIMQSFYDDAGRV